MGKLAQGMWKLYYLGTFSVNLILFLNLKIYLKKNEAHKQLKNIELDFPIFS